LNQHGHSIDVPLSIDESALTGESLPVDKGKGETAYSSSVVKQGQMMGIVTQTGFHTFIGRAAHLMTATQPVGHFQKVVNRIGVILVALVLTAVAIVLIAKSAAGYHFRDQLELVLAMTIASIPVGLPTVMSVTLAVGANQLARRNVIVKRLMAIEELAGVEILCSDKVRRSPSIPRGHRSH